MAWTATLIGAQDRRSHWKILIEFSDGTDTKQVAYKFTGSTISALKAFVRQKAIDFENSDTIDLLPLINQSIDVTPPVPDPPDPPTQAELDRRAWFDDYRQLQAMLQVTADIPALDTAQAQTAIANLRTTLGAGWLNSYLDNIR